MNTIKIIIADSYFLSRKGLVALVEENIDFQLAAECATTLDLMSRTKVMNPDLIIIDYTSEHFSLESLKSITKQYPSAKLLAITHFRDKNSISIAMNAGVMSHLLKDCDKAEITEAIYSTANGTAFMCGKIVNELIEKSQEKTNNSCAGLNISERELEIIGLIAQGLSNKKVADKLFLSTHTIITHRKNIMNKLGVNNTAGLVLFAVKENLVSPNHFLFSSTN